VKPAPIGASILYGLGVFFGLLRAVAWSSVRAPFTAHVLTVLYYRLTEPEQPVVHEDVWRWTSVWAGPTAEG
jgi:hypothetical protein